MRSYELSRAEQSGIVCYSVLYAIYATQIGSRMRFFLIGFFLYAFW